MRAKTVAIAAVLCLLSAFPAAAGVISDQWMEIEMGGKKIGFSHQKVSTTKGGYRVEAKALMKLEIQGTSQDISTSSTYFLDGSFKPLRFTYMQKMLNHRQYFEGVVNGNVMEVTVESAGNISKKSVPIEANLYVADAMNLLMGKKKLKGGEKFEFRIFLEPLLAADTMTVEVGKLMEIDHNGAKAKVFPVTMKIKSFLTVTYLTPEGKVLREISPMGFVARAVSAKQALDFPQERVSFTNLLAYSLIPVERPMENAYAAVSMKARITNLSAKGLLPNDDRQRLITEEQDKNGAGGSWNAIIEVRAGQAPKMTAAAVPAAITPYLKPTIEAQSDDPAIIAKAREIAGTDGDLYRAAVKINQWVFRNVEKKYVDTFSGVATLKSLEGECQSHANLFVALAKSAGIPARAVSGIVYTEQYKGFLYHAWAEVWAGEWIAMDPTFGQDIADATHIKLAEGELSSQLRLFEFIGKIGVEPLTMEYKK